MIFNNEEERFSGEKHTNAYPRHSIDAMLSAMSRMGLGVAHIDAWVASWDYVALWSTLIRITLDEAPASFSLLREQDTPAFNLRAVDRGMRASRHITEHLGLSEPVSLIGTPHHDNHAWFSFAASPFARDKEPTMVAVLDGFGDMGAVSLYVCQDGRMQRIYCNNSIFDSLGVFYSVISSTQGGWTWLSSEGRYMGATAYGNNDRKTNPYYAALKPIFDFAADGQIFLNRDLANWQRDIRDNPYTDALTRILGEPIAQKDMWNPDAVLRVEDIRHKENTQERLDKAAATQMVFEDALIHVIAHFIRTTKSDRLVLTGGTALNALANMRLLEHFDEDFYRRELGRTGRLHLWVPPVPSDTGVTVGAAYMAAYLAGHGIGAPIEHAFYCGSPPSERDIRAALDASPDLEWIELKSATDADMQAQFADFMAYMTAQDAIFALYQGAAETGPRALGHRSILANPCNPKTRENLNARVKYREAIRPLAPMMTLEAAKQFFELSDGASDADLQRLQLHGAHSAREAGGACAHSIRRARRRDRPHPDRAREDRPAHVHVSEGARPPYRRRSRREHLVQCRGPHCADAGSGARHAAPFQSTRCRADVLRRRSGVCRTARRGANRRHALPSVAGRLAERNRAAPGALAATPHPRPAPVRRQRLFAPALPA